MKRNGKCQCARPAAPAAALFEKPGGGGSDRNRKTYLNRLAEMGLTEPPRATAGEAPSALELAQLAATLEKNQGERMSAGELAARAREIYNASVNAAFIEKMAAYLVKGACYFDVDDWATHCRSLLALFDDAKGAVPGQSSSKYFRESTRQARVKAGAAVLQVWTRGSREDHGKEVIRALFPAKSETEESRSTKLLSLLEFAKVKVNEGGCDELTWRAKDGNRLRACLLHAWGPLAFPAEEALIIEKAAEGWLEFPKTIGVPEMGALPMLARWLAVLRMEQAAEAKIRV